MTHPATHEKGAFVSRPRPGAADEDRRRHESVPADRAVLLKQAAIADDSIGLDPSTHTLLATLWRRRDHGMAARPGHPVMPRWWAALADLTDTHPSHEPVVTTVVPVWHLP